MGDMINKTEFTTWSAFEISARNSVTNCFTVTALMSLSWPGKVCLHMPSRMSQSWKKNQIKNQHCNFNLQKLPFKEFQVQRIQYNILSPTQKFFHSSLRKIVAQLICINLSVSLHIIQDHKTSRKRVFKRGKGPNLI